MAPGAFAFRDFRLLTQARFLFTLAVQLQAVVMGWRMYELTRDPLQLGLIGLAEAIPALSLALPAGAIVDRHNPLTIFRLVFFTSLLSGLLLLGVSAPVLGFSLEAQRWGIFAAALVTGTARSFSAPSLYSMIPRIVPRESLSISTAWVTSSFQIAAVSGPALGGALYAWQGPLLPFITVCVLISAGIVTLACVGFKHVPGEQKSGAPEPLLERLTSGLRFVFGHPLLLSALALDMFAVLFGGVTAILPVFAAEILQTGPVGLGWLRGSPSVGALVMSIWLIRRPIHKHAGAILLSCVAGYGFCILGFALSKELWLSMALLCAAGGFDSVSMVIRGSIVQLCSPEHMRGRIASVNAIFIGSSNELGAFESGLAAKLLGTVPSVLFGGTMTLLSVIGATMLSPRLRKMNIGEL